MLDRLNALKKRGVIAAYEAPHPNRGLSGGMLPWVIMPATCGPATTYYNDYDLNEAVTVLEMFGPAQLTGRR